MLLSIQQLSALQKAPAPIPFSGIWTLQLHTDGFIAMNRSSWSGIGRGTGSSKLRGTGKEMSRAWSGWVGIPSHGNISVLSGSTTQLSVLSCQSWYFSILSRGGMRERGQGARREPTSWVAGQAGDVVH